MSGNGKMSLEQVADIYRIYQEITKKIFTSDFNDFIQVELDPKTAQKIGDENGYISREDFFKFAVDTKLLDFGSAMGESISMGTLFSKPRKVPSPVGDRRQAFEAKSPPKQIANKQVKKVRKVLADEI